MSFVYQSASLQNKYSSLFSQSASGLDWGNDCMLYHSHKRNNFLKKIIKLYCHYYIILLFACYSAETCWANFTGNWLTKYIQVTCIDRAIANSIPCMALINPRMAAMYINQNKMTIAAKNNSCILPYPCDVWGGITSSITLKIYATALSYWAWTM